MNREPVLAAIVLLSGVIWRNYANVTSTAALVLSIYTLVVAQRELRHARRAALDEMRARPGG